MAAGSATVTTRGPFLAGGGTLLLVHLYRPLVRTGPLVAFSLRGGCSPGPFPLGFLGPERTRVLTGGGTLLLVLAPDCVGWGPPVAADMVSFRVLFDQNWGGGWCPFPLNFLGPTGSPEPRRSTFRFGFASNVDGVGGPVVAHRFSF